MNETHSLDSIKDIKREADINHAYAIELCVVQATPSHDPSRDKCMYLCCNTHSNRMQLNIDTLFQKGTNLKPHSSLASQVPWTHPSRDK